MLVVLSNLIIFLKKTLCLDTYYVFMQVYTILKNDYNVVFLLLKLNKYHKNA